MALIRLPGLLALGLLSDLLCWQAHTRGVWPVRALSVVPREGLLFVLCEMRQAGRTRGAVSTTEGLGLPFVIGVN